jgi:hypothetical protein
MLAKPMKADTRDHEQDLEDLLTEAGDYLETRTTLWKLKTVESLSDLSSEIVSRLCLICVFSLFVITINVGFALLIGDWMGKSFYGFFIIGGLYGLIGLIFYANRTRWMKEPVGNMIIRKIFK